MSGTIVTNHITHLKEYCKSHCVLLKIVNDSKQLNSKELCKTMASNSTAK